MTTAGLDPSFGQGGVVLGPAVLDTQSSFTIGNSRATVQADGRVVVVTGFYLLSDPSPTLTVQRFDADGSPDETFGVDGSVSLPVPAGRNECSLPDVAIAPDGKIVVAVGLSAFNSQTGTDPASEESIIIRLTGTGQLDPTFAQGGEFVDAQPGAQLSRVLVQGDGRIVAGGTTGANAAGPLMPATPGHQQVTLLRLTSDGVLDPSFNGSGTLDVVPPALNTFSVDSLSGLALGPGGRIVVASDLTDFGTPMAPPLGATLLTRINPDGTPDATFGAGGTVAVTGEIAGVSGLVVQPDGAIALAGQIPVASTAPPDLFHHGTQATKAGLVRFLPDGSVDPSLQFAATEAPLAGTQITAVALGADGEFTLAGRVYLNNPAPGDGTSPRGQYETVVERYLADGTPDPAFGSCGVLTLAVAPSPVAGQPGAVSTLEPLSVSITPAGKVLLAGQLDISTIDSQGDYGATLGRQLALTQILPTTPGADPTPTPIVTDPTLVVPPAPIVNPPSPPISAPAPVSVTPMPIAAPAPTPPAAPPADDPTNPEAPSPTPTTSPDEPVAMDPVVAPSPSAGKALSHSHTASHLRRATSTAASHPKASHAKSNHHVTRQAPSLTHAKPSNAASTHHVATQLASTRPAAARHVVAKRRTHLA